MEMDSHEDFLTELKNAIKSYPGFPKKGIIFRDIFPIFQWPHLLNGMIITLEEWIKANAPVQCIVGLESRGFLIGPTLAYKLGVPFVPIRKAGKLPGKVKKVIYSLEYGSDALEIQEDSLKKEDDVLIVDDLLATGGSLEAAEKLVSSTGAKVKQCLVIMELVELNGRSKVKSPVHSLMQF